MWRRGPAIAQNFLLNHQRMVSSTEDSVIRGDTRVNGGFFSSEHLDIAPFPLELAPSQIRSYLTYKARSYFASYGH